MRKVVGGGAFEKGWGEEGAGAEIAFPFHFLIERRCWEGAGGGGVSHQAAVPREGVKKVRGKACVLWPSFGRGINGRRY